MKNNLIVAAVTIGLQVSYVSAGQFAVRHDPWPLLCVLSIVLIASVGGLLRRDAQVLIFSFK